MLHFASWFYSNICNYFRASHLFGTVYYLLISHQVSVYVDNLVTPCSITTGQGIRLNDATANINVLKLRRQHSRRKYLLQDFRNVLGIHADK